jgi:mono/diheme cytochrome c family protein
MRRFARLLVVLLALVGCAAIGAGIWLLSGGIDAQRNPAALEAGIAHRLRALAIPSAARARRNPVPPSGEALAEGKAHFADHCAACHGNDGGGDTAMGRGLYPRAPDMRLDATQSLTDGELLYIIEHGVRFTGMPAWGDGTPESEAASWRLVHFIRHLPKLTPSEVEEMKRLNPKGPAEWREEEEMRKFLERGTPPPSRTPATPSPHKHKHGGH